uniref:Glycosyltransferase RgtA/B/C/D-like domain-containing protein n=1 Tax=Thermodesulfobacterium geofontis TaxID=1295609 RepID=A0A7V4N3I2_9BACT
MKKERLYILILLICSGFLIFWNLGKRPLFGVEGRWGEAAREMVLKGSWFVPTINFEPHVTKPLIPFWLIKLSGMVFQDFNEFTVRLPGALLAFFSLWFFYKAVTKLFSYPWNLISTGILLTSLGFIEFSRLSQSEIYQLFGIIVSLTFYIYFRDQKSFLGYLGFFIGMVFGALSKGITSFAVLFTFPLIDALIEKRFYHLNWKSLIAGILVLGFYFLPYYLTAQELQSQLPFYLWLRENLKQAVEPYDNLRPFYIYFLYWPLWLAPWSFFLFGAILKFAKRFKQISNEEKLFFLTSLAIFLLFTVAKARRGYYILPILPFSVILITYYLKNHLDEFLFKFYNFIRFLLIILTLELFLILPYLQLKIPFTVAITLILGFFLQVLVFLFYKKERFFSFILQFIVIEWLIYAMLIPHYSKSSEKETGKFLAKLSYEIPQAFICQVNNPVANVYFYAQISKKIEPFSKDKNCHILLVRKELTPEIKSLLERGYYFMEFKAEKEPSKNYYILYKSL